MKTNGPFAEKTGQFQRHATIWRHQELTSAPLWYNFYPMYKFEFDHNKSSMNLDKHGIDFVDAQEFWSDPGLIQVQARSEDEPRYLVVGLIAEKYWSAVITYRGHAIRLISVRRSRKAEVSLYEGESVR